MRSEETGKNDFSSSGIQKDFRFSEHLDREHLLMIYEDDLERAAAIFEIFVSGIDKEMSGLVVLEVENNAVEFVRKVHKVAPNFAMVGLSEASKELLEIESTGKNEGISPRVREMFNSFREKLERRLELIENELVRIHKHLKA